MLLADANSVFPLNWAVLFPVVTGFLAVAYLLPTPRSRGVVNGVLGVIVALLGFGTFLYVGLGVEPPCSAELFLFASFALTAFTFAVLMIVQRNPARSALFFAVVVLSVCGLFLLLAAPFLMAATIIIYAGAIIVTFLFVIMLSQQRGQTDANDRSREPSLAAAVGFVILGTLFVVLQRVYVTSEVDELLRQSDRYAKMEAVDEGLRSPTRANAFIADLISVRQRFGYGRIDIPSEIDGVRRREPASDAVEEFREALNLNPPAMPPAAGSETKINPEEVRRAAAQISYELSYLKAVREGRITPAAAGVVLSPYGQSRPVTPTQDPAKATANRLPNANIAAIGRVLFADHLIAVELGGTLLLVATIGAISLAGGRSEKTV